MNIELNPKNAETLAKYAALAAHAQKKAILSQFVMRLLLFLTQGGCGNRGSDVIRFGHQFHNPPVAMTAKITSLLDLKKELQDNFAELKIDFLPPPGLLATVVDHVVVGMRISG